ncbi:sensor histidine kinase [Burkholderiaceae bacterium DAT-1]|nr:sensor histidine kinase [Burkholderiaceae bacterium DAT-1]
MQDVRQKMVPTGRMQCWISLFFLLFVGMPFISDNFMSPLNQWSGLVSILACIAYVPMHFASYRIRDSRTLYLITLATFLIGALALPFNWACYTFFIYACFIGGDFFSRKERIAQFLLVNIGSWGVYSLLNVWLGYPIIQGFVTFTAGLGIWSEFERKQKLIKVAELEIAQERMAKSADRDRIARDMHDLLGHTLSMIALKAELASKLAEREPARAATESAEVAAIAREALTQVRQAILGLKSVSLIEAVRQSEATLTAAGITHHFTVQPIASLDAASEHALAQTLTESITNIIRHSGASEVWISVTQDSHDVVLQVRDNGKAVAGSIKEGNGLSGMRQRLASVDGELKIVVEHGMQLRASLRSKLAT